MGKWIPSHFGFSGGHLRHGGRTPVGPSPRAGAKLDRKKVPGPRLDHDNGEPWHWRHAKTTDPAGIVAMMLATGSMVRPHNQLPGRSEMKALLVGVALLALTVPAAYAQSGSQEMPPPEMEGPGQYRVFFAFDRANLSDADRQIIAQAVEDYRRTGTARITATGHTDTSGSAAYNLELSQRRAEAVASELVRQGVPATEIVTIGRGEEDLLVPTADGVREPRNRRVEIVIPQPPPARSCASSSRRGTDAGASSRRARSVHLRARPGVRAQFRRDRRRWRRQDPKRPRRCRADVPGPARLPGRRVLEADGLVEPQRHRRRAHRPLGRQSRLRA